jgi:uncharacterized protein YndB with AHSA1/START domain
MTRVRRGITGSLPDARPVRLAAVSGSIVIRRPPEVVFDTIADERNEPHYNRRMRWVEQITPGPVGVGTKFRAHATSPTGGAVPMVIEFTEVDRPHRLASVTYLRTMQVRGVLTFEAVPAGTKLGWYWQFQLRGVRTLLGPIVAAVGRRQERAVWQGLKRFLEHHHGGARTAR